MTKCVYIWAIFIRDGLENIGKEKMTSATSRLRNRSFSGKIGINRNRPEK